MEGFQPFSVLHGVAFAGCALVVWTVSAVGRRLRSTAAERPFRRGLGWAAAVVWCASQAWWLAPANFDWARSLPLHLCDLTGLVAAIALLTDRRLFGTLLYFWGIVLSSQGLLTPTLTQGPDSPVFWLFWITHTVNVGLAVFEVAAGRFVPSRRDLIVAIGVTGAFTAAAVVLNLLTGWNYAYVGRETAPQPTALDLLGPWPWRLLSLSALGMCGFVFAWAPWEVRRRIRGM